MVRRTLLLFVDGRSAVWASRLEDLVTTHAADFAIRELYARLLAARNRRSADDMVALFASCASGTGPLPEQDQCFVRRV